MVKRKKQFSKKWTKYEIQRRYRQRVIQARRSQPMFEVIENETTSSQSSLSMQSLDTSVDDRPDVRLSEPAIDPDTEGPSLVIPQLTDQPQLQYSSEEASSADENEQVHCSEADSMIYKESAISLKDFLVSLNTLKSKHNLSDLVFKDILAFCALILPKPNNIPKNNHFVEDKLFNKCEGT